jgi:hypothetical protein
MTYEVDFAASARRHWTDADKLLELKRIQNAGYHYGFAAECALKSVMRDHGIPHSEDRRSDPFWAHFPDLRTLLIRDGKGRLPQRLYNLIAHGSFLQFWHTDMRYAKDHSVEEARVSQWRDQADKIFGLVFFGGG